MSKTGTRISQCMIVKNEEKNIERALSWGKSVMWEQIVVDTGSTDRTVEIARRLGARVETFPWIDDFSAAKNYAIEQCNGDWIALLDADEYMMPEDAERLPEFIEELNRRGLDGLSTGWQQLDEEGRIFSSGTQVRIFRNLPDIRYRRRIHEQLESQKGRRLRLGDAVEQLSIFHTGYQSQVLAEKKSSGRNRKLILEELKNNPEDYEMMGYMGDECFNDGDRDEAVRWYKGAVEHMPQELKEEDQRSAATFTNLLMLLTGEESLWGRAEKVYKKATALLPWEADFDYVMGRFYASREQAEKAVFHLEAAVEKLNTYGCSNKALHTAANLLEVYDLLARCCFEAGQREKCMTYAVTFLKYDRYNMAVLSRLLRVLLPSGGQNSSQENQAVLDFFSRLYDFSALKDRLFLVKAAGMSDCGVFAESAAARLFTQEERTRLGL